MFVRLSVALALISVSVPSLQAQRDEPTKSSSKVLGAFRDVVSRAYPSVVQVLSNGKEVGLGTVIGKEGWVLTKNSLLGDRLAVKLADDSTFEAKLVGVKDDYDLALLKIEAKGLVATPLKSARDATPGDWVASAGTGKGPMAIGVVSVATRKMTRRDYPPAPSPNSGFLGINLSDDSGAVRVGGVQDNSAASKAGLKVGDLILSINAKPITDSDTLMNTIAGYKPNDTITIKIKRDDKEEEVKATLGKRPVNRGDFQNRLGGELSERRSGFPAILQHDTVLTPKQCGGPLVDLDGNVIAINIARAGRTESYAIPAENVLAVLDDLKSGKLAPVVGKVPDMTKLPDSEIIKKLRLAVEDAQRKVKVAEEKSVIAGKILAEAKAAIDNFGKNDPDLVDVHNRAREVAARADTALAEARKILANSIAELKKAEDETKK